MTDSKSSLPFRLSLPSRLLLRFGLGRTGFGWWAVSLSFFFTTPGMATTIELTRLSQELTDLSGKPSAFNPTQDRVLVTFWATWCGDCKSKMKNELLVWSKFPGVEILTVNTEKDGERVADFLKKESIALPVRMDPKKKLRAPLKVFSVPHWAVFKKNPNATPPTWGLVDAAPAFDNDRVRTALNLK